MTRQQTPPTATVQRPYSACEAQVLLLADFLGTLDGQTTYARLRRVLAVGGIDEGALPRWFREMEDDLPVTRRAVANLLLSVAQHPPLRTGR